MARERDLRSAAAIAAALVLAGCGRTDPPARPATPRIAELLVLMTKQGDEHPGHGPYHRARNELEAELWPLVRNLPVVDKGDELLLLAVENVYTRFDPNYLNGYPWHWPYLCSPRAIALVDKLLAEYPRTGVRERALWLKAFALRCPAAAPDAQAEADLVVYREQVRWKPDHEQARALYREVAGLDGPHAAKARELAAQPDLTLTLPKGPLTADPRSP